MTAIPTRRRRLIEVAFPLEEVSAHSRREKNVRQGHISTLHIWWARRPLAACRAFIYASLVDDPDNDVEREALLKEVADLASWDAVRHPEKVVRPKTGRRQRPDRVGAFGARPPTHPPLQRRQAAQAARPLRRRRGHPPRGLRLGCEVEASDLNPVAVLILKGTLEYPRSTASPTAVSRRNTSSRPLRTPRRAGSPTAI